MFGGAEMNWKEKYGEWGVVLGATEGMGQCMAEAIAERGMNVVLVGRREEMLRDLGKEISKKYGVAHKVVRADFAVDGCVETVTKVTDALDMGFMSYVACSHQFGKVQNMPWEDHWRMMNVNVISFMKFMYHYLAIFAKQDRGAIINISSLTGITSSPYIAQYGAGKAYILKMTEAVAYECAKTNVDVLVITAGSTITPTWLKNQPGGPAGEAARKKAMLPEDVIAEAVEELGKKRSIVAGDGNKAAVRHFLTDMTADEQAAMMGSYYES